MQKRGLIFLLVVVLIAGCVSDQIVDPGDLIEYTYVLSDAKGEVLDTNLRAIAQAEGIYKDYITYDTVEYVVGSKVLNPKVEDAMIGMKRGESKRVSLSIQEAFGIKEEFPEEVFKRDRFESQNAFNPRDLNYLVNERGERVPYYVLRTYGDDIIVTRSHPFAGKEVVYDIQIIWIGKA